MTKKHTKISKYRTLEEKEFVVGFKFESNFWFCSKSGDWEEFELTGENIKDFLALYEGDAYPTEFRVLNKGEIFIFEFDGREIGIDKESYENMVKFNEEETRKIFFNE